jgi:hypothetical protein
MNNATWEDWERWYEQFRPESAAAGNARRRKQRTVFLSNGAFVSLVAIAAALGGVAQGTRVDGHRKTVSQIREEMHENASAEFRRVKEEARGTSKDQRIEHFLRSRDPDAYAHEGLRSVLLGPDVCGPGQGKGGGAYNKDADLRRNYRDTGQKQHPFQYKVDAAQARERARA